MKKKQKKKTPPHNTGVKGYGIQFSFITSHGQTMLT